MHFLQFILFDDEEFFLVVDTLLRLVEFLFAPSEVFLSLIEGDFPLFESAFALLDFLCPVLDFLFEFSFFVDEFFFYLEEFFLLEHFGFIFGRVYYLIIFSFCHMHEKHVAGDSSDEECNHRNNYWNAHVIILVFEINIFS